MRFLGSVLVVATLAAIGLTAQETVFRTSAQVLTITVSVTDKDGRPISDIRPEELTILDDGRRREIQSFSQSSDVPLTLGLVVDNSGSQHEYVEQHREDMRQFLRQVLHKGDRAFLVAIPGPAMLEQDVTDSVKDLTSAVNHLGDKFRIPLGGMNRLKTFGGPCRTNNGCGSLIWNGVWGSAGLRLFKVKGRKAILLMSDGQDTGSDHSLKDAIDAAQAADAPVYTIGSAAAPIFRGGRGLPRAAGLVIDGGLDDLRRLAEQTGGAYFAASEDPAKVFAQIEAELRYLYVLSFGVPEQDRDGRFHRLVVTSNRDGARVRSREGYVAEK
jgi:VWFA-related protein